MNHARSAGVLILLSAAVGCVSGADAPDRPAPSPPAAAGSSPVARPSAPVTPPALDGGTAGAHGPAHGNAGFPVACGAGKPAVTSHALALPAAHRAGTVRVTAPSGVTWAVTVGRDGPAEIPPA
ncbi:hypothetical protein [Streptomyces sp. enrichment culture]|uniref:hypothetical protein n=1 Tax=Streptomyces sp. enrichment culture TaxID=1795815 RepID=UPI003F57EBB5